MGFGNGIGIGWPNASAYSSIPPATEKYLINDCVGYYSLFTSTAYPVGTFQVNDRVYYNDGDSSFGLIDSISTDPNSYFPIYPTGVNTTECFDNNIVFNATNDWNGNEFYFRVELNSANNNFISADNEYPMHIPYYNEALVLVYIEDPGGAYYDDRFVSFSGNLTLNNYYFGQGGDYEVIYASQYISSPYPYEIINYSEQYVVLNVYFDNIERYNPSGCNNPYYFLRFGGDLSGETFTGTWRDDNC